VVVYVGAGCHLCEAARSVVDEVCSERGMAVRTVEIDGDGELEAAYRERIPVVEVDGETAFTYFVHADRLRALLDA
jgi:glutaredoxin